MQKQLQLQLQLLCATGPRYQCVDLCAADGRIDASPPRLALLPGAQQSPNSEVQGALEEVVVVAAAAAATAAATAPLQGP